MSVILSLLLTSTAFAQSNLTIEKLEQKIELLEARTVMLEEALKRNTQSCRLIYKKRGNRLGFCPQGDFISSITEVATSTYQVQCGNYEVVCN